MVSLLSSFSSCSTATVRSTKATGHDMHVTAAACDPKYKKHVAQLPAMTTIVHAYSGAPALNRFFRGQVLCAVQRFTRVRARCSIVYLGALPWSALLVRESPKLSSTFPSGSFPSDCGLFCEADLQLGCLRRCPLAVDCRGKDVGSFWPGKVAKSKPRPACDRFL